jgi:protein MAK11
MDAFFPQPDDAPAGPPPPFEVHAFLGTYSGGILGYTTPNPAGPAPDALPVRKRCAMAVHDGSVKSLALNAAGRTAILATGGADEYIRLFDLDQYREKGQLSKHEGAITALRFSPDGRFLLSGSEDGLLCVWRVYDFECLLSAKAHKKALISIAVHPSGKFALTTGRDRRLKIWDLSKLTGAAVSSLPTDEEVEQAVFSPSGATYALLGHRRVHVYRTGETGRLCTLEHEYRANAVVYASEDVLATAGEDKTLRLWRVPQSAAAPADGAVAPPAAGELVCAWASGQPTRLRRLGVTHAGDGADSTAYLWAASSNGVVQAWALGAEQLATGAGLSTESAVAVAGERSDVRAVSMAVGVVEAAEARKARRIKAHKAPGEAKRKRKEKRERQRRKKEEEARAAEQAARKNKKKRRAEAPVEGEGASKRAAKLAKKEKERVMKKRLMMSRYKRSKGKGKGQGKGTKGRARERKAFR